MKIDIITLFPEMFSGPFSSSIISRAVKKGLVTINTHNLRSWANDKRGTVDDRPFGGGPGMILMVEPLDKALKALGADKARTILLDPTGKPFNQASAKRLSHFSRLIFVCGHYEGVDERVKAHLVDEVISIGDYVLTGGELPAMVVIDSLIRLLPGVLGKDESTHDESFNHHLLEYSQYTRPAEYRGWKVPKELLSGNHQKIKDWKEQQAKAKTKKLRPDLI